MDNSSSFSSQPRSFLFLLEPIRASTEKAWALELRAAADRLLSLISLKSTRRGEDAAKNPLRPSNAVKQNSTKKKKNEKKKCTRQCLQRDANSPSVQSNPNCELETLRQTFEGRLNHLGCARDRDGTTDSFDVVCRFARLSVLPLRVFLFLFLSL